MASSSPSPAARRERRRPRLAPSGGQYEDGDDVGWLVTFSDLVLQLFAFVILVATLGGTRGPAAGGPGAPATVVPVPTVRRATAHARETGAVERTARDADGMAPAPEERTLPEAGVDRGRPAVPAALASEPSSAGLHPAEPPPLAPVALEAAAARLAAAARAAGHGDTVSVTTTAGAVIVGLGEAVGFVSASATLRPEALRLLDDVRALAATLGDLTIEVTGHTDDRPIRTPLFPSNLELSLARAAAVARALAADPALAERVTARGVGEHRPIASNADRAGRARNRRVEIRLVPPAVG